MTHPSFAFVVVFASLVVWHGQLGVKVSIKVWWTQYPNWQLAGSWKTPKKGKN
jgi:hypothetical protein